MNKRSFIISFFCVLVSLVMMAQRTESHRDDEVSEGLRYNEAIFLVSNYSVENQSNGERLSLGDLLDRDTEGFYFYIKEDEPSGRLLLRCPDGSFQDFKAALVELRKALDKWPEKIVTLFLDYYVDIDLQRLFEDVGLDDYLLNYDPESGWPTLEAMLDKGQRLVVFDLRHHLNSPDWLLRFSDFVVGRDLGWGEPVVDYASLFETQKRKKLAFYVGLRSLGQARGGDGDEEQRIENIARKTPFLIEDFREKWLEMGKIPNYVLVDRFYPWINLFLMTVRDFRIVRGEVRLSNDLASYVNWKGLGNYTSGDFCFPVGEGAELELMPSVPGCRVEPGSVKVTGAGEGKILDAGVFNAYQLPIGNGLELYLPFDGDGVDRSGRSRRLLSEGVGFVSDPERGQVAYWKNGGKIDLPPARELNMGNHDFTVSVWLKIPEYLSGKDDYCVLGGKDDMYQKALHFLIRDGRSYMGFFNNDLAGNTRIEPNRWYHVVWRYNKGNGEQAIFVNGKLDAVAWGRPAYLGADSLYVGYMGFSRSSGFSGCLDDFAIWSRVLGDKEILALYNQLVDFESGGGWRGRTGLVVVGSLVALVCVILLVFWMFRYRRRRGARTIPPVVADAPVETGLGAVQASGRANRICLFGDFQVLDRDGIDISTLFTPKLRQLFLLILVHSQPGGPGGISGPDLSRMIWGEPGDKKMKSLRSVSLLKLRKILERMDRVEILYNANRYELCFSNGVYCDYLVSLRWLKGKQICSINDFERFCEVIGRGELFKGESFAWLDDSKNYIGSCVVDVLSRFIGSYSVKDQAEKIIHVADQILLNDPCNSLALSYKVTVLVAQGKVKSAHYVYDKFCLLYKEMYGEPYPIAFEKIDPTTVRGFD